MNSRRVFFVVLGVLAVLIAVTFITRNTSTNAVTYVNLSFNPNIEFILDTNNRVVSVNSINDDGELLVNYGNYEGQDIKNVIQMMLELASKSGLLDVNVTDGVVYVTVVNENASYADSLFTNLKDVCNNYFKSNGIYAFAAAVQLPDEIITLASEYNLSVGHLRLLLKLKELNPDLTWDELVVMPIPDVISNIHSYFASIGKIPSASKEAYKTARIQLRQTFENNVRTLFGTEYSDLLDELDLLESQIDVVEGEALDNLKVAIENKRTQINTLRTTLEVTYQTEYQALLDQYKLDKEALMVQYQEEYNAMKASLKTTLENHISQNQARLQARIAYAKNRSNDFANKYRTFLALKQLDLFNFLQTQMTSIDSINEEVLAELQTALQEAERYAALYQETTTIPD